MTDVGQVLFADGAGRRQSLSVSRHVDIKHGDFRLEGLNQAQRLRTVIGFGQHHHAPSLFSMILRNPLSQQRMVHPANDQADFVCSYSESMAKTVSRQAAKATKKRKEAWTYEGEAFCPFLSFCFTLRLCGLGVRFQFARASINGGPSRKVPRPSAESITTSPPSISAYVR